MHHRASMHSGEIFVNIFFNIKEQKRDYELIWNRFKEKMNSAFFILSLEMLLSILIMLFVLPITKLRFFINNLKRLIFLFHFQFQSVTILRQIFILELLAPGFIGVASTGTMVATKLTKVTDEQIW